MGLLKNFFTNLKTKKTPIDEQFYEEFEEKLIEADMGPLATEQILDDLKKDSSNKNINDIEHLKQYLKDYLAQLISSKEEEWQDNQNELKIILFTGINGVGKTTSLAKLAHYLQSKGKKLKLVAGDTFRAAAIEQLTVWAERLNLPIIKSTQGSDPAAIVFDGITSAINDNCDYLLIDTAGRMHTSDNLMRELQKIKNICLKKVKEENIKNILVIDSTTGHNGFNQAEIFKKFIPVSGVFLAKYDSIFKGGIIIRISKELQIPIQFIGTGETVSDFHFFNKNNFIESLGL